VPGDRQGVPLDPRQDGGWQHDIIPVHAGRPGEAEADAAHRLERHLKQVTAVDVELDAQMVQLGEHALGIGDGQPGDLGLQTRVVLARPGDHHDVAAPGIGDQQQGQLQAPQG
jgi:hypothetical protein